MESQLILPVLQPVSCNTPMTCDEYDIGCSVHGLQPDLPLDNHFGVEYAVVSLAPYTGMEYAPECVGSVLPLERGHPDHHLTHLPWKRINPAVETKFHTMNRRCEFFFTPLSNTSWPFTFMMEWPNTLGLWKLDCANSKKWWKSYLLLRSFRLQPITIGMLNEGLQPVRNSTSSETTLVGRMLSGREVLRLNIAMNTTIIEVMRQFMLLHQIPDHKKRTFQFTFENLKRPLKMGMRSINWTDLWSATCLTASQDHIECLAGSHRMACLTASMEQQPLGGEACHLEDIRRIAASDGTDGLQPAMEQGMLGTTSGACNQTDFANESVIGSGPDMYCLQNLACSSHHRGSSNHVSAHCLCD